MTALHDWALLQHAFAEPGGGGGSGGSAAVVLDAKMEQGAASTGGSGENPAMTPQLRLDDMCATPRGALTVNTVTV